MKHLELLGFNDEQQVAEVVQAIEPSMIKSDKMRAQFAKLRNKQSGFTLLELLVVISIIAVLGGLAIGAFGDKTSKASKSSATHSMASLQSAVLGFQATSGVLPNNLDTLVCADATTLDYTLATTTDFGGTSDLPAVGGGMGLKLNGKITRAVLPDTMATALNAAGITTLRYASNLSCVDDGTGVGGAIAAPAADTDVGAGVGLASSFNYPTGNLSAVDIPLRAFDFPISNTGNRGRGFSKVIDGTNNHVAQIWNRGGALTGENNVKVGAGKADVLVALGIGNNSSILTDTANAALASAAFYADVGRDKYARYLMLAKVGTDIDGDLTTVLPADQAALSKAKLIAIIDPRGDFLDEEYAEATGQKQ